MSVLIKLEKFQLSILFWFSNKGSNISKNGISRHSRSYIDVKQIYFNFVLKQYALKLLFSSQYLDCQYQCQFDTGTVALLSPVPHDSQYLSKLPYTAVHFTELYHCMVPKRFAKCFWL